MAFIAQDLSLILQPIGGVGLRMFSYRTDDGEATLEAADYIPNATRYGVRVDDIIFISQKTSGADPYIMVVSEIDAADNATLVLGDPLDARSGSLRIVADRTALKQLALAGFTVAFLRENGRAGFFQWDASVLVATHQADSQEGIYVAPSAGSNGAWVRQFDGDILGSWFGMTGDGSTNNWTAFTVAMTVAAAFGRRLRVNRASGTYRLDLTSNIAYTLPANLRLFMETGATLEVIGTGTRQPFNIINDNVTFERLNLLVSNFTGGTLLFLNPGGGAKNFVWESGDVDGGIIESGGSINWTVQIMRNRANENFTNLRFGDGLSIKNCSRVYYRLSSDTGTVRGLRVGKMRCETFYSAPFACNSPSGIMDDFEFDGTYIKDNLARVVSNTDIFHIGFGSATNGRFINCRLEGAGNGYHSEEKTENVSIIGGQVSLTDAEAKAFFFAENNVGGTVRSPKRLHIEGVTMIGPGKSNTDSKGIWIADSGVSGASGASGVKVIGCHAEGWGTGYDINSDYESFFNDISLNTAEDCAIGFKSNFALRRARLNQVINCDTPFSATSSGGTWGKENTVAYRFADMLSTDTFAAKFPNWAIHTGSTPAAAPIVFFNGYVRLSSSSTSGFAGGASQIAGPALIQTPSKGPIIFEARIALSQITSIEAFIGFTDLQTLERTADIAGGDALTTTATDAVGVLFNTGADTDNWWLIGVAGDVDATKQNTALAPVAGTFETWRIEVEDGTARFFRNGNALVGSAMTGAVGNSAVLYPVLWVAPRSGVAVNMQVEWIRYQTGP